MQKHIQLAKLIAHVLDAQFTFLGFSFGLDPILGLIPGIGDTITLIFSLYIVWVGYRLRATPLDLLKMLKNIITDSVVGSLPVVGDAFDFAFKANLKNIEILLKYENGPEVMEAEVVD